MLKVKYFLHIFGAGIIFKKYFTQCLMMSCYGKLINRIKNRIFGFTSYIWRIKYMNIDTILELFYHI